eukprot:9741364-Ditylum_brightwellii.AAC.1
MNERTQKRALHHMARPISRNCLQVSPKIPHNKQMTPRTQKKNTPSTKQVQTVNENLDEDITQEMDNIKIHEMFAIIVKKGKIYSEQIRYFSIFSSKGIKCIMVIYVYNSNAILTTCIKNRKEGEQLRAYQSLYKYQNS